MARVRVVNDISGFETNIAHDSRNMSGGFLGWIRLLRPDGEDSGYVYLCDEPVAPHLGGKEQNGGPYVVMSRPAKDAPSLIATLSRNGALQMRYDGDDELTGSAVITPLTGWVASEIQADIEARFNVRCRPPTKHEYVLP